MAEFISTGGPKANTAAETNTFDAEYWKQYTHTHHHVRIAVCVAQPDWDKGEDKTPIYHTDIFLADGSTKKALDFTLPNQTTKNGQVTIAWLYKCCKNGRKRSCKKLMINAGRTEGVVFVQSVRLNGAARVARRIL